MRHPAPLRLNALCIANAMPKHWNTTHGMTGTKTHYTWLNMRARCLNPRHRQYADYGGRGITICDRWKLSFSAFLTDMGEVPDGLQLDRFPDNDGNYEPGNCRWATPKENCVNRRNTHLITHCGATKSLTEWAEQAGLTRRGLWQRIYKMQWPMERAISEPKRGAK